MQVFEIGIPFPAGVHKGGQARHDAHQKGGIAKGCLAYKAQQKSNECAKYAVFVMGRRIGKVLHGFEFMGWENMPALPTGFAS